jgi:hypothetical protein
MPVRQIVRIDEQLCNSCGADERISYLIPIRHAGDSLWICTRCLPTLIHG